MKRSRRTFTSVWLMGLLGCSLTSSSLFSQDPNGGGLEIVELSGKLELILGNQIKLKSEDGQESVVLVGNDTTFSYKGTAEPTALASGQLVRFTAPFDAAGTPQAPLTELEIFTPVRARRMSPEMRQRQTPDVYPATDKDDDKKAQAGKAAGSKKAPEKNNAKPVPGSPATKTPPANKSRVATTAAGTVQDYLVVGMLRAIQGDKLLIVAGSRQVMVQADPGLKITVSAGDPTFCLPGDEIKLTGLKSPAGLIQADTIEVTGAKPLGSVDEKAQARKKRGKPGEKEEEADPKAKSNEKSKPK